MNENIGLLQESYYGKDDILLECEKCIKALKEAIIIGKNPNSINEKTELESLIAKKFNCEKVYFSIIPFENYMNAFTMPFYYEKNRSADNSFYDLVSDSSGIRYKTATGKILYIYIYTYTIRNFSIDNIMSILLHEIGHNFFFIKEQIQNRKAKVFTEFVLELLKILDQFNYHPALVAEVVKVLINQGLNFKKGTQQNLYDQYKKTLTDKAFDIVNGKYKSTHTGIGKVFYTLFTIVSKTIGGIFKLANSIVYTLLFPVLINASSYKNLEKSSKKDQAYAAEKFCDNFAASYGYAVGVAETFNSSNMTYDQKIGSKIPLIRVIDYYSNSLLYFVMYMNDPHPTNHKRVTFMLEKLKYELEYNKKNMSPKQVEEIEKDIISIEKLLKKSPYFKRAIDNLFSGIDVKRDKAGSAGISDKEIYDFDKKLIKDRIKKEEVGIEAYLNEGYENVIDEYFSSPVMEVLNEETTYDI